MSQKNVEVVLLLSDANDQRDWDAVCEAYAPDIEWEDCTGLWGDWGLPADMKGSGKPGVSGSRRWAR
jgi:hypothetical protein